MKEFIAKKPWMLYWYCKEFLVYGYDYTIEHFEIKPDKVAFRLKADLIDEEAEKFQNAVMLFYK